MDQRTDRVRWVADDEEEPPRKRARNDMSVRDYHYSERDHPQYQSDQETDDFEYENSYQEQWDQESDDSAQQQSVCGAVRAIACNSVAQDEERPVLIREKIRGLIYCEHCWSESGHNSGFGGEYVDDCSSCLRSPLPREEYPALPDTDRIYYEQIDVPSLEEYVAKGTDRRQEDAEKYLELAKYHDGKIPQTFEYQEIGFGRRVSKGQPSLQTITVESRMAALGRGRHQIWDIVNCFPSIALQMAKRMRGCNHDKHALHTLEAYCHNRDPFLQEIKAIYTYIDNPSVHCSLKDAKNLFIRILSGGNLSGWKRDKGLEARGGHERFICIHMPMFMKFLVDCCFVHDIISKARSDLVQWFRNDGRRRPCATAQAYAFQNIEDRALLIVEELVRLLFGSNSVQTPLFDGLIITPPSWISDEAMQLSFQTAESLIYRKLDYKLKFSRRH